MARFGIEGIRYFANLRATGLASEAEDLTYVFNICNGLDEELRDAGHTRQFYWANRDCWEIDLHAAVSMELTTVGGRRGCILYPDARQRLGWQHHPRLRHQHQRVDWQLRKLAAR